MISFTDFLLGRRKRYKNFTDAFLDYQKHISGLDLETMEAKYKAIYHFHSNEDKESDDDEEGDTESLGIKGSGYDFGNYALNDASTIDPSSMYSDYAASQMLQASIETHLESHLAHMKRKIKLVPMLYQAVDQEVHPDEEQEGDEQDMDTENGNDGNNDSTNDHGKDVVKDAQMEKVDILNNNTKDAGQENLRHDLGPKTRANRDNLAEYEVAE